MTDVTCVRCKQTRERVAAPPFRNEFGDRITFWGGGIDTQQTLPFGTPEQVRTQVEERMEIFGNGGGFVFNAIHNVQAGVPAENTITMFRTAREYGIYGQ